MNNSRRAAAFAVARWLAQKSPPAELLPEGPDRAFVQDVVYTVVRRLRPLREILGEVVKKWPKGELEALLYVGAAQIFYMDGVPDFAAVNETAEAAKECENKSVVKVVNGVLRNLIRRRGELAAKIAASPLEVRESFPTALVGRWRTRFGDDGAEKLCRWHNEPAVTYLARRDGTFTALERGRKVQAAAGYAAGEFIVQDPGTAAAVDMLEVRPGDVVADVCAAPGGKTVQLAWRGAKVIACEVNPRRRRTLEETIARTGVDAAVEDSIDPVRLRGAGVVKVLVDAPCSNTGVLRRRPDARWNWSEEKLAKLVALQAEILDTAAAATPAGGVLVYSTCSNEPEENEAQAAAFTRRHHDFEMTASAESVPFVTGHDGAFAARFTRRRGADFLT